MNISYTIFKVITYSILIVAISFGLYEVNTMLAEHQTMLLVDKALLEESSVEIKDSLNEIKEGKLGKYLVYTAEEDKSLLKIQYSVGKYKCIQTVRPNPKKDIDKIIADSVDIIALDKNLTDNYYDHSINKDETGKIKVTIKDSYSTYEGIKEFRK